MFWMSAFVQHAALDVPDWLGFRLDTNSVPTGTHDAAGTCQLLHSYASAWLLLF